MTVLQPATQPARIAEWRLGIQNSERDRISLAQAAGKLLRVDISFFDKRCRGCKRFLSPEWFHNRRARRRFFSGDAFR